MLTPLLNDNDDSIGPPDTKRKNNYQYNDNNKIYNENNINNKNDIRKNIFPKKKKLNINNKNNENIYND